MSPIPPLPSLAPSMADSTSPANVFAQMKFGAPSISIPSSPPNNTSPANVFAQMKSGTFETGNEASNPQLAGQYSKCLCPATRSPCAKDKYDALRPNRKFMRDMLAVLSDPLSTSSSCNAAYRLYGLRRKQLPAGFLGLLISGGFLAMLSPNTPLNRIPRRYSELSCTLSNSLREANSNEKQPETLSNLWYDISRKKACG
jgi:hypothetical protein